MAVCGAIVVGAALHREVISILPFGVEGDGPGYLSYGKALVERGWRAVDPLWQPGYAILVAWVSPFVGEPFRAGVLISAIAALGFLICSYLFVAERCGASVGLVATALVASSELFICNGCSVNSDMTYACLAMASVAVLFAKPTTTVWHLCGAGLFAGAAYAVRQQALILPVIAALVVLVRGRRGRAGMVACYAGGFLLASAPVMLAYAVKYGNPLYNEQFLNLAGSAYYNGDLNLFFHGGHAERYSSWGQVLTEQPAIIARFLMGNLWSTLVVLFTETHQVPLLWILAAIGMATIDRRGEYAVLALLALSLLSAAPIEIQARYLLLAMPLYMAFVARGALWLLDRARDKVSRRLPQAALAVICLVCSAGLAMRAAVRVIENEDPVFREAGLLLRHGARREDKAPFVAIYPFHVGYYAQRRGFFPIAPRFRGNGYSLPAADDALRSILNETGAGYVLYYECKDFKNPPFPHLVSIGRAPPYLKPIGERESPRIVLYRVGTNDSSRGVY